MTAPRRARRLLLALVLGAGPAAAGEVELGLLAGGQQTGGLSSFEGSVDLRGGLLYGVAAGWRVRPDGIVEVAWSRQQSEASGEDFDDGPVRFDVTIDTLEVGGLWETRPGRFRPFLGLSIGATRLAGSDQEFGEGWYLSGALGGGVRYQLGEHALLRLEARATGILIADGGSLGCGVSGGAACQLSLSGSLLGAVSARVGLAARF